MAEFQSQKRKRNTTACQVCRARKTKCDNKKPRCSYCQSIGAACTVESIQQPAFPYPPDTQAVLERIDRLEKTLLQASSESRAKPQNSPRNSGGQFHSVENVLLWPVFEGRYRGDTNLREMMSRGPILDYLSPQSGRTSGMISFELESCSRLLDNFFSRIHIKNPVLDEQEVRSWTREIAFNGIDWNTKSCLVLLVCALGAISTPFDPIGDGPQSFRESDDFQLAEAWFTASQKRLGPVLSKGSGLLEAQCLFFSGVYLAHNFKPFAAWPMFLQALAFCQSFKCATSDHSVEFTAQDFEADGTGWRSEESMYWTCFKSELELRFELSLPGFPAADLSYPEFLPSPPPDQIRRQDQAWYFYLAEISLRRLANSILSEALPISNPHAPILLTGYVDLLPSLESQAEQWSQLLPPEVDINTIEHQDDVLRFILKGHLLNCYEAMYWPFIVTAVNHPLNRDMSLDHFVQKALRVHVDRVWVNESGFRHRHHGTWGMMRSLTRSALVLIASKSCGHLDHLIPHDWEPTVRKVIELLDIWIGECGDALSRRNILSDALNSLTSIL